MVSLNPDEQPEAQAVVNKLRGIRRSLENKYPDGGPSSSGVKGKLRKAGKGPDAPVGESLPPAKKRRVDHPVELPDQPRSKKLGKINSPPSAQEEM
jgi:hypothetical protein